MKASGFWERLKAKYTRKGGSIQVTRQALSLGAAHATTGIHAQGFTESSIDMIIINEREVRVETPAGPMHYIEAIGFTDTQVVEGDKIKLYTALAQEKIDNGGFEDDLNSWNQTGTPTIEIVEFYAGAKSLDLDTNDAVDQTLSSPASVAEMMKSLSLYKVMTVVPSKLATVTTHYVVKLIRLHEPVNFGKFGYWLYMNNDNCGAYTVKWRITVTYTDDTTTVINNELYLEAFGGQDWTYYDETANLVGTKVIKNIKITGIQIATDFFVDEVSLLA